MSDMQEPDVGSRIRALRQARGLSLRALAERAGLAPNTISLIERGENSATVSSLHALATALNVAITDFFRDADERAVIHLRPEMRLRWESNGVAMESLGSGLPGQQLEPFLVRLAPGAGTTAQPVRHTGEELVYCLAGLIEYRVGDECYRLAPGDALLFEAEVAHAFENVGSEAAQMVLVFRGAGGPQPRRLHMSTALDSDAG